MAAYQFRVGFTDVDYFKIVFFGDYLKWMDRAFEVKLVESGLPYNVIVDELGIGIPIVETRCRYFSALRYGDDVVLPLRLSEMTARGFSVEFQLIRQSDSRVCAAGFTRRRFVRAEPYGGTTLPDDVFRRFAAIPSDAEWRSDTTARPENPGAQQSQSPPRNGQPERLRGGRE